MLDGWENIINIIGLFGLVIGLELIAAGIFILSIMYLRSPQIAGIIGSLSSMTMTLGLITFFLRKG